MGKRRTEEAKGAQDGKQKSTALAKRLKAAEIQMPAEFAQTPWRHPAAAYLARLHSPRSRTVMQWALNRASGGDIWGFAWQNLRRAEMLHLRSHLLQELRPSSVNHVLSAVRGVLKEAWLAGLMDGEDYRRAADIGSIRELRAPAGRALSASEQRRILEAVFADTSGRGSRDAALLAILLSTGLRRSELVGLDLSDYMAETRALNVRSGKGRKDRTVYVTAGARNALEAWLDVRGEAAGPLLCRLNKHGGIAIKRLSSQSVYLVLRERARAAGVRDVSPHDLRRTFTSGLLESGADLSVVQSLLGHASPSTTARYDRRGERAKAAAMERYIVPGLERKASAEA